MEKAVVLGLGVNKASASEALSGERGCTLGTAPSAHCFGRRMQAGCNLGLPALHAPRPAAHMHPAPPPPLPSPCAASPLPLCGPPADLIERYAQLLAANGRLRIALEYLQMIPGGLDKIKSINFFIIGLPSCGNCARVLTDDPRCACLN